MIQFNLHDRNISDIGTHETASHIWNLELLLFKRLNYNRLPIL